MDRLIGFDPQLLHDAVLTGINIFILFFALSYLLFNPVRDVLEKVVTDYAILPAKPNMEEVKRALTLLENHAIIQRVDGKFNQGSCKFVILPTILTAVSGEKLSAVVSVLGKEDADEEAEEDSVD